MTRLKQRIYDIITEPRSDDLLGQFIHISILMLIAVNVVIGILETIPSLHAKYQVFFYWFEATSVGIFTIEYLLRLWSCTSQPEFQHPLHGRWHAATQPMAIIDLLAIAPFYMQILFAGIDLRFIRILRLFRLFRIFRVGRLTQSLITLVNVFRRKKDELFMACIVVFVLVVFAASLMYLAEHHVPDSKFTSIPASMWWAIITITTIGYGDVVPVTPIGQILGAVIGFLGVCTFALPVAIIGAGFIEAVDPEFQLHPVKPDHPSPSEIIHTTPINILPPSDPSPSLLTPDTHTTLPQPLPEPPTNLAPHSWFYPPADDHVSPSHTGIPQAPSASSPLAHQNTLPTIHPAILDAIAERVAQKIAHQLTDRILAELSNQKSTSQPLE